MICFAERSRHPSSLIRASKAREIEDAVYDLKAVNPHRKPDVDDRTPEDLLNIIEAKGREISEGLTALRERGGLR